MSKKSKTRPLGMYKGIDTTKHAGEDPYDYLDRMDDAAAKWEQDNIPDEVLKEVFHQINPGKR
ncbi:MAG: hypothetical protein A2283_04825 [Lentisphaerae bacterium RIFOXYA12_FULL_48_11]|nr:MAG: hypothetical protein A2283_04825 [Lentisphaerae bacterium RIFOXYA12_FULL_48_11]